MKMLILVLIFISAGAWHVYNRPSVQVITNADLYLLDLPTPTVIYSSPPATAITTTATTYPRYSCDGRQHCSQMSSCAEAKFFINNCPNTKMDGDHDGIPCERQFCN
ncbi:MAG: excalibur calcium-binding domain-containing protein [Oceanospirillaceae bacterium]